ncbi:MAG TPA: biopolymer transporter ExbB, partial [Candidatus Cloacimonas sp.]|nr:biopolymer transporter ExbB [Candidatus Cloacimonas sp.]
MSKRLLTVLIIMAMVIMTNIAFAQDEVPAEQEAAAEQVETDTTAAAAETFEEIPEIGGLEMFARKIVGSGLVDLFIQGGFVMWPLLVLVIWALATIIWKLVSLSYAKINLTDFMDKLLPLIEEKKYKEAMDLCENTRGPVAAVIYAGLQM